MVFIPALYETGEYDVSRYDVIKPIHIPNLRSITRLKRFEGARNPQTGKIAITYEEEDAKAAARSLKPDELDVIPSGSEPADFLVLLTQDGFVPLDRAEIDAIIEEAITPLLYEVQNVSETWNGDSFAYRSVLVKLVAE